jgi:prepilin-type N-terminal cleavage/methylation domain-containing protein
MSIKGGFTIVELMIVIVVIGILAGITVVSYNGTQVKARAVDQISVAKTYLDMFDMYLTYNHSYPATNGSQRICLGINVTSCTTATASWTRDSTLETNLKTVSPNLPVANSAVPIGNSPKMAYVPISDVTLDGVITPFIIYTVEAPNTCGLKVVSGTWPNYSSSPPAQGYTSSNGNLRVCNVAMPLP